MLVWNHEWIWGLKILSNGLPLSLMMVIPENERSGNNPIPKNQKQRNQANALIVLQMHRDRMGTGVERLKQIDAANLKFITCVFFVHFFPIIGVVPRTTRSVPQVVYCRRFKGLYDEGQQGPQLWEGNGTSRGSPNGSLRGCRETSERCILWPILQYKGSLKGPRNSSRRSLGLLSETLSETPPYSCCPFKLQAFFAVLKVSHWHFPIDFSWLWFEDNSHLESAGMAMLALKRQEKNQSYYPGLLVRTVGRWANVHGKIRELFMCEWTEQTINILTLCSSEKCPWIVKEDNVNASAHDLSESWTRREGYIECTWVRFTLQSENVS